MSNLKRLFALPSRWKRHISRQWLQTVRSLHVLGYGEPFKLSSWNQGKRKVRLILIFFIFKLSTVDNCRWESTFLHFGRCYLQFHYFVSRSCSIHSQKLVALRISQPRSVHQDLFYAHTISPTSIHFSVNRYSEAGHR